MDEWMGVWKDEVLTSSLNILKEDSTGTNAMWSLCYEWITITHPIPKKRAPRKET